jgi:hypothetical protein
MIVFRLTWLYFLLIMSLSAVISAQDRWTGIYEFDEDGGKTAGGTRVTVHHEIRILDSGEGLIAMIKSQGYQTSRDLVCTAKIEGSKLKIYLGDYGEDNVFETYQRGELLLTLERKAEKGKTMLLTHWGAFKPIVPSNERSGRVYFVMSEEEIYED